MTGEERADLTARRLALRLEEVSRSLERAPVAPRDAERLLELASAATVHAVSLHLLTAERADAVWAEAASRHPVLATVPRAPR